MFLRRSIHGVRTALIVSLFSVTNVAWAFPDDPFGSPQKVDKQVESLAQQGQTQRVIVELVDTWVDDDAPVNPRSPIKVSAAELQARQSDRDARKQKLVTGLSAIDKVNVIHELRSFRSIALWASPAHVAELASNPGVLRVHADRVSKKQSLEAAAFTGAEEWHNAGVKGQGLTVAVLDTPVRYNNGFFGTCPSPGASGCKVATSVNIAGVDEAQLISLEGPLSHGSNVAGIVLSMAPEARVAALNVFHWDDAAQDTLSYSSDQIAGLDWVAQNASSYSIVSVNMSIGSEEPYDVCNDDPRYDPIRTLYADHNVVTVISAGNEAHPNAVGVPGCISLAMTIGAQLDSVPYDWCGMGEQQPGEIACFSNRSGLVDMVAPGVDISAGGVPNLGGTSMAAPHIAGAIALLQENWGAPADPSTAFWIATGLHSWSVPQPRGAERYDSLRLNHPLHWDYGAGFSYWYRESAGNVIPTGGAVYSDTNDVSDTGTVAGVYLNLEILHPTPHDVRVRVTNPQGAFVDTLLPSGLSHFSGTLGRTHFPGLYDAITGGSVTGIWTIELTDTGSSGTGHFLRGALFFAYNGCVKDCDGSTCGDDACGGTCSICLIDDTCVASGTTHPTQQCKGCIPSKSATAWSTKDSGSCDDDNLCTLNDTCQTGVCKGTPKQCPSPAPCKASGQCKLSDGTCMYNDLPDGTPCDGGTCQNGACEPEPSTGGSAGSGGNGGSGVGGSGLAGTGTAGVGVGGASVSGAAGSTSGGKSGSSSGNSGSSGASSGNAGALPNGGSGGSDESPSAATPAEDDSGCGCRTTPHEGTRSLSVFGLGIVVLLSRRRRVSASHT